MTAAPSLPESWSAGTVEANGVALHYTRTGPGDGEKPPLVLAHGVYDDGQTRTPLARDLAERFDVVMYDARGHGRSAAPESGYEMADRVADLVGVCEALDISDPVLMGHSMGGDTVLSAAAEHPDFPRAVVAIDPGSLVDKPDGSDPGRLAAIRERIEWWNDHNRDELLELDDELRALVADDRRDLATLLADARRRVDPAITAVFEAGWLDLPAVAGDITAPTLLMRADVDEARKERDRAIAAEFPDARLVHVDCAGHTIIRDQREAATRTLRTFLDGVAHD